MLHTEALQLLFHVKSEDEDIYLQSIFDSPFLSPLIICYLLDGLLPKLLLNLMQSQKYPFLPQGRLLVEIRRGGGEQAKLKMPKGWLGRGGEGGGRDNQTNSHLSGVWILSK